jgi:predicted CXXCH cytochrome family protein
MRRLTHNRSVQHAGVAAISSVFLACTVSAGTIEGTRHDFSDEGWNTTGEICIVCHTPHNADVSVTDAPLWNHELTTATFDLYDSPTFDADDIGQPTGASILCLSCHDGTVALDAFGGTVSSEPTISGSALIGADLSNDHPISFTYDSALALADGALFDPASTTVTIGSDKTRTGTIAEIMLFNDSMQCASCHDVHNTFTADDKLLRISNDASGLCLTCHDK